MYKIEFTNQYLKDLKLIRKRKLDESKLNDLIKLLLTNEILPASYRDHPLSGKMKGFSECHISPDWLLIYEKNNNLHTLTLIRTGTHSDLF